MAAPRFLARLSGILTDMAAAVVSTPNAVVGTNSAGVIDASFFPAGFGADIVTAPASEALTAGNQVNLWGNAGATNVRKADNATANAGKGSDGFVLASVASGNTASVYRSGMNTQLSGLTPGVDYYLGASGAVINAAADAALGSGTTSQYLGKAINATTLDQQPGRPIAVN